jgi:large subunit ribosomal protein L9
MTAGPTHFVGAVLFLYNQRNYTVMKVILLRDIARLGQRGDLKEVAEGYAINVLIKKGDAVHATPAELAKWKSKQDAREHKKETESNAFVRLIDALRATEVVISGKKADQKGQLFASIKESDIADAIYKTTGLSIDPRQIILAAHIKSVGKHPITLKQGTRSETVNISVA